MSDEAFARSTARESRIWKPFAYSFPFNDNQTADRITIFGLYANAYLNGHKYLNEIEDEELANMLSDYTSKIAELTTQEQIVVADIVSKRYLANVDKLVHDQKMITKQADIDSDDAVMDARIAALSADRAALTTMAAKVATEITKNTARIAELQAYIQMEGLNLSLADIEVAEKEIQSAKLDNEKLNMANEILRIQIETIETAQELLDIDLKIARTRVDIAETERSIAKLGLLADDLVIEQARTALEQAGIPVSAARINLATAKYNDADAEKTYFETTLMAQEAESLVSKTELLDMKQTSRLSELERREDLQELANDKEEDMADLGVSLATDDQLTQGNIDAAHVAVSAAQGVNAWTRVQGAIDAADIMAGAKITTQLTHTIQKAT